MPARALCTLLAAALLAACGSGSQAAEPTPITAAPTSPPEPQAPAVPPTSPPEPQAPAAGSQDEAQPQPSAGPEPTAPPASAGALSIGLELVADGFASPTHVTAAGDGSGRLFVVEQHGRIRVVRDGAPLDEPFLDIGPLVGSRGNEQGLLSIAFHPAFAENGRFFINYTNRDGDTVVARYSVAADNPDRADPESAAVLLIVDQPAPNHNGGLLKFGPDGYLYIGMGDGGAAGDPWGNGQSLDTLLGKLLRVDVDGGDPYAIPPDNPFAGRDGARPEIWAYGLRNPWRFSFDRATGDLFIADVGQNAQEEINFRPASSRGGENYGWDIMEGTACYDAQHCDQTQMILPVATYSHSGAEGGCSVTGGYVYRGAAFPQMEGVYFYADFCSGNLWGLRQPFAEGDNALIRKLDLRVSSFGEDEAGELYLADRSGGGLYRLVVE